MNRGRRGRRRGIFGLGKTLIFESILPLCPRSHRALRFFNVRRKRREDPYCINSIYYILHIVIYTLSYIFTIIIIYYIPYPAYGHALFRRPLKKSGARWDCGHTPCKLLRDRVCKVLQNAPSASTRPPIFDFIKKDNTAASVHQSIARLPVRRRQHVDPAVAKH
jgi:hypothetical protein